MKTLNKGVHRLQMIAYMDEQSIITGLNVLNLQIKQSKMTKEGQKYKYSGLNIRDFGQLQTSLHTHFWHISREQEKAIKNLNSKSLSVILNKTRLQKIQILQYTHTYIYIYIYSEVKLATVGEGDTKALFSIVTTPRCKGGWYSFPWIAQLCPWSVPYIAVKVASSTIF